MSNYLKMNFNVKARRQMFYVKYLAQLQAMKAMTDRQIKEATEKKIKEKELSKIKISKDDVDLIVSCNFSVS